MKNSQQEKLQLEKVLVPSRANSQLHVLPLLTSEMFLAFGGALGSGFPEEQRMML